MVTKILKRIFYFTFSITSAFPIFLRQKCGKIILRNIQRCVKEIKKVELMLYITIYTNIQIKFKIFCIRTVYLFHM